MTQARLGGDGALRAAALAAVEQYLSDERATEPAAPRRWRAMARPGSRHLRPSLTQPTLWRAMGWANTSFANRGTSPTS